MSTPTLHGSEHDAAVVWVDCWHSTVAASHLGRRSITEVDRGSEPQPQYLLRVARVTDDCDRLMILGPAPTGLDFEHEYVALYQRPDRFIDVEAAAGATTAELLARLNLLDDDGRLGA